MFIIIKYFAIVLSIVMLLDRLANEYCEILYLHLIPYLSMKSLFALSQVCHSLRYFIDCICADKIWKQTCLKNNIVPARKQMMLQNMHRYCSSCFIAIHDHPLAILLNHDILTPSLRWQALQGNSAFPRQNNNLFDANGIYRMLETSWADQNGITIGSNSGVYSFGANNICLGNNADVRHKRIHDSVQIGNNCIGQTSRTIHIGSAHYKNIVLITGPSGFVPELPENTIASNEKAEECEIALGGLYCVANTNPTLLYIRTK